MRPYILVACALGLVSCSTAVPTAELAPIAVAPTSEVSASTTVESDCDSPVDTSGLAEVDDPLAMLTASIALVEARDAECGLPSDEDRQCRALFLLGATEPVLLWASGADPLATQESVNVWRYAAADGLASSSPDTQEMWEILVDFSRQIGAALGSNNEETIANLVIDRGEAAEVMAVIEGVCEL